MHRSTRKNLQALQIVLSAIVAMCLAGPTMLSAWAQTPPTTTATATVSAPASATASQRGTVKAISGAVITMATDKGETVSVTVADGAKLLQLAVGSTDLKTAKPGQLSDIAVGDRALVTGKAGDDPGTFRALRVILMKSSDIAQMNADQQADWKTRGMDGIVSAVDPVSGTIAITSGTKKFAINTSGKTVFRRFAGDSVKYQDAKTGTLAQIQPKDQLQARGAKSADGSSMQAEEIISGSFTNLSGLLLNVDGAAGTITLKDLATKKVVTVKVTANSDIRNMPLQLATRFAQQSSGGGARGGGGQAASGGNNAGTRRTAGADLSQMIGRLPTITPAELKKGDAVMIVASEPQPNSSALTAVTVLSGVDPILTANPNGGMDLSMSVSGGGGGGE